MRILLFGDSITHGEFDSQGGWATRIVRDYFNAWRGNLDADLPLAYNLGIGGDTTKHVTERLPHELDARRSLWSDTTDFALVFAIGINDSVSIDGKPFSSTEQYGQDLRSLYAEAQKYTDKIMFVGLTPVDADNPRASKYTNERILQFEQVLCAFVQENSLPFVPLLEAFKARAESGEALYADGLHPNDDGHILMYGHIKPQLDALVAVA